MPGACGRVCFLAAVGGFLSSWWASAPIRAQDAELTAIAAAWAQRQEKVRSAKISWSEQKMEPKGCRSVLPSRVTGFDEDAIVPPQDRTVELKKSLALNGEAFRFERHDVSW